VTLLGLLITVRGRLADPEVFIDGTSANQPGKPRKAFKYKETSM
jgi:hypothetical protein